MENAIQKAIEGGFEKAKKILNMDGTINVRSKPELFLLDPLFWQALSKSLDWGIRVDTAAGPTKIGRNGYINVWQSYWHDLIDHLALGYDIDSFFDKMFK